MKTETFIKRTELNRRSKEFGYFVDLAEKGFCFPCENTGKGRYIKQDDRTLSMKEYLRKARISYKLTNNAPRGGKSGNMISISKLEQKKLSCLV